MDAPWVPVALHSSTAQSSLGNSQRSQDVSSQCQSSVKWQTSYSGHHSRRMREGFKTTIWEASALEWVLMNTASLITNICSLFKGGVKDTGVWNKEKLASDLCETYPCHGVVARERGEEVPPGTFRLYFFWPPCQPRLSVYTSSSSLLLLHCCLSASIP